MSPLLVAARLIARHYPGGAAGLGRDMGGKTNLADELNPNLPKSKLGLEDAVEMEILANDFQILYEHCAMTGHLPPLRRPEGYHLGEGHCMRTLSEMLKASSDLVAATVDSLADNEVSDNELQRFEAEAGTLIVKLQALRSQMAAKNARTKARAA